MFGRDFRHAALSVTLLTITVLMTQARDGAQMMGWYFILRPEHGPAKLSPLHMSEATEAAGQLVGMLR
jgi:hypothetical protein